MKDFEGAISRGKLFQPANELVTSAPNCTSLLHLNVFVFLFLLTLLRTTFSPFCRHALCCLLALFFSLMLLLSFQSLRFPLNSHLSTQLYVGQPVSLLHSGSSLFFFFFQKLDVSFSCTKAGFRDDGHAITCHHSFLYQCHYHHLFFFIAAAIVAVVTAAAS